MEPFFCLRPWENLVVDVDGDCYFCCYISRASGTLGNINRMPLEEIWHSRTARRIRWKIAQGVMPPECVDCGLFLPPQRPAGRWHALIERTERIRPAAGRLLRLVTGK